jgi:long-chain acyl-CoA synthetase
MLEKLRIFLDNSITMANFFERIGRFYGNRSTLLDTPLEYITVSGKELSHEDGVRFSCRVSQVLAERLGLRKGDVVGVCTSNNVDLFLILMAVFRIGAIAVPLNYMLRQRELKYILEDCGARTLILDPEVYRQNIRDTSLLPSIQNWVMAGPYREVPPGEGFLSLDTLMAEVPDSFVPVEIGPEEPVAIFYTSGTTGFPKGAIMCSRGLLGPQKLAALCMPVGSKDFGVFALPLAHIMGFCTVLMGLCAGVSGYFITHFDPEKVMRALERFRAKAFAGVPAMYALMIHGNMERYDLGSVKLWGSAADAMPEEYVKVLRTVGASVRMGPFRLPPVIAEVYGMVELSGACTLKLSFPGIRYPAGCVGFPVFPTKVSIVDEEGRRVSRGEAGELAVKGPGVTSGYWNKDAETAACFTPEGWFRTGDMARRGRWGLIYFVDRKKDVIKSGGYSIFSREVEEELLTHEKIAEAAVIGVPHPTKKEMPVGIVCLKPGVEATDEELLEWCKKHIAYYKAPRDIKIIPASEMPYGMTLKVLKRRLRERYLEEYRKRFQQAEEATSRKP